MISRIFEKLDTDSDAIIFFDVASGPVTVDMVRVVHTSMVQHDP
jgi:hypothetical protein